jgi:CheY-like chemotaxis protein
MCKILVIDDDPYVQRFYEQLFDAHKHNMIAAKTAEEGLALAKAHHPAVILLDILMPQTDGMQILELLKADSQTKDIPTIMLTNVDDPQIARKAKALGATDFIIKSAAPSEVLLQLIEGYLKKP